jgi:putative restriction endonuclease
MKQIIETVEGAQLDEELYTLLCTEKFRNMLRIVLIETYFTAEAQQELVEQGIINAEAFEYSQTLLEQARKQQIKEVQTEQTKYRPAARDQGFRHAVVTAYDHRCALCGIRVLTPDGHTAVVGAHIIPWSESQNDDPRNGMALCYLCHWTFDEGLIGVSPDYVLMTSPRLTVTPNIPSHLATLHSRGLIGPKDKMLWPDPTSLKWHLREIFRKY